jgi:hypothetical protein
MTQGSNEVKRRRRKEKANNLQIKMWGKFPKKTAIRERRIPTVSCEI